MSKAVFSSIKRNALRRSFTVSVAALRAGGALAVDRAWDHLQPNRTDGHAMLEREAQRFVAELGRLKGTYVKVGQLCALMGEQFLPPALTAALHELESHTEPLAWSTIEPVLRASLGERYGDLDIDPQPLAAASLAQVHRARIVSTGEQICLKVLYPGVKDTIDDDFNAVVRMLKLARWLKSGRELDTWLEDLRQQLHLETDYRREAQMGQRMADLVAGDARYRVPRVHADFSSGNVLALEYLDGVCVTSAQVAALSLARRNRLATAMLDLFLSEMYEWDVMQTDSNFGNFRIAIGPRSDQLILLDFGAMMTCSARFSQALRQTVAGAQQGDDARAVEGLVGLGCLRAGSSAQAQASFVDFCHSLLEPFQDPAELPAAYLNEKGQYCWRTSDLMKRVSMQAGTAALSGHFGTPSRDFAFIARKLGGVFSFIAQLGAEFNGGALLNQYVERWQAPSRRARA
ncbi:MAG: AarF/ABC1/UbiB kinase family protein [Pseudomonadota bacterium]